MTRAHFHPASGPAALSPRPGPTAPSAPRHGQPSYIGNPRHHSGGGGSRECRDPAGQPGAAAEPAERAPAPFSTPPVRRRELAVPRGQPWPGAPARATPRTWQFSGEKAEDWGGLVLSRPTAPLTPARETRLSRACPCGSASRRQRQPGTGSARTGSLVLSAPARFAGAPAECLCGEGHRCGHGLRLAGPARSPGAAGHRQTPGSRSEAAERRCRGGAPRALAGSTGGERRRPHPAPAGGAAAEATQMKGCARRGSPRRQVLSSPPPGPPSPPRLHMSEFTDLAAAFYNTEL